jgi:diguanylate cyclase (GGDEF)-like protein/PAS domain S-box-containing protein
MPGADTNDAAEAEDSSLVTDLRQAVARGELSLAYQPIVDAKTRALAGVEALARWNCPSRGFVPPDRFIPVAEEAGLIEAITDFVLRRAIGELAPLFDLHPCLTLSINLAAHEVSPSRVGELLVLLATPDAVTPDRLQFEITERTLLGDRDDVHAALMTLAKSGARVAIDDFGTGYSSLSYLDAYPIHCLKIDKSFVQRLGSSAPTRKITETILLMAGALDLQTVAEGVETIEQLTFLIGKGCRYIQGNLFSCPLSVVALEAFVADFRFPTDLLGAALWPPHLALPRVLADNEEKAMCLFFRHVPAEVAMFDTAMRYVAASARWLETYEIAGVDAIGRCFYDVLPDTPQQWRDAHARCLAGGGAMQAEDDCFVHPDGRREWTSSDIQPITNTAGDVIGIVIFSERITARKLAEQHQHEGEQRLAAFLAISSDWIFELDADLRFVMPSGALLGQQRSVDIGCRPWELPDLEPGQDDVLHAHIAALKAHRPFRNHIIARKPTCGEVCWNEISGQPIFAEDGSFRGYLGTVRDVTEEQRAQFEVKASASRNELYRRVFESLGDCVFVKDVSGHFLLANDTTAKRMGVASEADLLGRHDRDFFPAAAAARFAADEQAILATGRDRMVEEPVPHLLGNARWKLSTKRIVRNADGSPFGIVGVEHDVGDLVRARDDGTWERQQNDLYRQGIEILPDLFFVKDLQHRFVVANHALARQVGAAGPADVMGRTDADFHAPAIARGFREEEAAVMISGAVKHIEQEARRADGTLGWFSTVKAPLRDATGNVVGLVGHSRDITDQKLAREALQRQSDEQRRFAETLATARREAEHARDMLSEAAMVMSDGFALFDPSDRLILCNSQFSLGHGLQPEGLIGLTFSEIMRLPGFRAGHALDDTSFEAWLDLRIASHRAADGTPFELQHHGSWFLLHERRTKDGSTVLSRTDITHLKNAQEDLRQLANRDPLTGLSNRRDFVEQASRRIQAGEGAAVVLFDIDHFKRINDTHGHLAGDATLYQLARMCAGLLRPTDLFAGWGGEEFILLLLSDEPSVPLQVVERLRGGIADLTVHHDRDRIRLTASFGVATCAGSSCALDTLIGRADAALYRAKRNGRNRIELAVPSPGVLAGT